ncbi:SAM hydrolase/SAM-dependent halogenase family protein [Natronoarchaeum rubrum]|uniref:SAM hydrolase/SAM-dependent halogenase family protein n=1 Tax=Natronoarchaeum rubrum TaxID=755311 RepID=UPI0021114BD5|nr:SAM-dependent chlorinase/fluorinase [Natronoarchaeum rubrum]
MITLSSDFGSPYPAAMKGVVLQRTDARLVDVSHAFPRQDVRAAAFWLREILPYFPPATHLVVVDPGVGTDRAAVAIEAGEHVLVGPDNGVLLPAARVLAGDAEAATSDADDAIRVHEISYENAASSTFHGRDVFAPTAAEIHESWAADGTVPDAVDGVGDVTPTDEFVDLDLPEPAIEGDAVRGEVLVVDDFGNAITNVPGYVLEGLDEVHVDGRAVPAVETFAEVPEGQWLATVGSHGNVELDVNRGRGDEAFGVEAGDSVRIEL